MLDKIIRFSIDNKLIIALFTVALIAWGSYSLVNLPIDAVPDITNNQVQVITAAPSQSALDIERLVTFPVEQTMATIPGIEEIRSFSRFGLSVVTIVFTEATDIYWARQQVNERLNAVIAQIPAGVGSPEMAPVTTGLGEIYQYIIRPKEGYENTYSATELRTIQDWIVRRQLLGTPGVADVASYGGFLKQYEIAVDPDKLRSYNISIPELFTALEQNNQNTGGAYIDKKPNAYFIRSEGLISSVSDIEKIVVRNSSNGIPILISHLAEVRFGHANRYGAMTYNNEGETTGGIVLMLKGENSNTVVERVKERVAQIEKTLPEGLTIHAFQERSGLVKRAIHTVRNNLIEGALIIIAVLVLFLGNLRGGLIVASVIPLSMLFAVALMNVFGVSGNLMSLGAIDFGLIVDGAVIIVEATLHQLGLSTITTRLTQREMDDRVHSSASKIMSSAAFGQIIILIVYLPILSLVGIEGKMFKPMAQTVAFAILGACILSLTYVPMMSALALSKTTGHTENFADRMMKFFHKLYAPVLTFSIRHKFAVVASAVVIFFISLGIFTRLGGEFLPTLEEGDLAIQTRVLTGSSLLYTIDNVQKTADILLQEFPDEVIEAVGKVGTSEIPTDPMPLETCDLIVMLKPKDEWTKAKTLDELIGKMRTKLSDIPGVAHGFQQPIQLRFNELMTGVREDVAVKIFGEDLETLTALSQQIAGIIRTTQGAQDLYLEEVTGLPQIIVGIHRDEVAKYGLNIETINQTLNTAFAGQTAGIVYEGEKRFDLVVRLHTANRQGIEDVQNLFVTTPTGVQVPLNQLADVSFKVGPNQIQREDAKRRIIVGFNVRSRDVAGVVKEIRERIEQEIKFPAGYYPTYGGQFENLQQAQARLSVAVPVALALIFILLFMTFNSAKQSLLIFSAIPMAAIGGVFALVLRGMPFSISAGVGFIALFGVAVLNGIVLIAEFNRLKKEGLTNLEDIVRLGTQVRLRPVLMTAMVASLGFLPMALATSAGAEVQKPLATVVIGGLITSTLLTLVVLPCLYLYFERSSSKKMTVKPMAMLALLFAVISVLPAQAQNQPQPGITLRDAIDRALKNNKSIEAASLNVAYQQQVKRSLTDIGKTNVELMYGQYNSYAREDNNVTITQTIPFPTVFAAQNKLGNSLVKASELQKASAENELVYQVKQVFYHLSYLNTRHQLLKQQDSIFQNFIQATDLRYKTGDARLLEKSTATLQHHEVQNLLIQNQADISIYERMLATLLNSNQPVHIASAEISERVLQVPDSLTNNPQLALLKQQVLVAERERKVTAAKMLPDITGGYFNQTLIDTQRSAGSPDLATKSDRFHGMQIGLAIPLWFGPQTARVKAAGINEQKAQKQYEYNYLLYNNQWQQALQEYTKNKNSITYYQTSALQNAELMLKQSALAFTNGEIGYTEYWLAIRNVMQLRENYLNSLNQLNQSVINLEFLAGIQ